MQCIDCHFEQDNHGSGKIYGEARAAIEIDCIDCHGTIRHKPRLSVPAPPLPKAGADSTPCARLGDFAVSNGAPTAS